jgi:hypothetical protein
VRSIHGAWPRGALAPMRDRKGGRDVRTEIGRADTQRLVAEGAQLVEVLPREECERGPS